MKKILLAPLWFCFWSMQGQSADCSSSVVVCGNERIETSVSGFGIQELDRNSNPCFAQESNSIWLELNIAESGMLAFDIIPTSTDLNEDFDFYLFGPNVDCPNLEAPIRCSTTNPMQAGLNYNTTGLRDQDLDSSEGPGELGDSYVTSVVVAAGESYRLLIDRPKGNSDFSLDWTGTAQFFEQAVINAPTPISICLGNPESEIDLTSKENEISTSPNILFEYYDQLASIYDGSQPLDNPTLFIPTAETNTIFVKITNDNGCFEVVDLVVAISEFIPISLDYAVCDTGNDNQENFQLALIDTEIRATLTNPANYDISFHSSLLDANTNNTPINRNVPYVSDSSILHVRVSEVGRTDCFTVMSLPLQVVPRAVSAITGLVQCDIDSENSTDGITRFNLRQVFDNEELLSYTVYESQDDLNNNNPITNISDYTNTTPFQQNLLYRASNALCEFNGTLQIEVLSVPELGTNELRYLSCENSNVDGRPSSAFDLKSIQQDYYPNDEVVYFATLDDATLELNPLPLNLSTETTTIYARVENENQCVGIRQIRLFVAAAPTLELEDDYVLCTNEGILTLDAPFGFDTYTWQRKTNGKWTTVDTDASINLTEIGNYRLNAENNLGGDVGSPVCLNSSYFQVISSSSPTSVSLEVTNNLNTNIVTVVAIGDGDYEYALNQGIYQDSPIFNNLSTGQSIIHVRDKYGCGSVERDIVILGYPKFFTPNADGENDIWQLLGVDETQMKLDISIFDRHGRLMLQMKPNDIGWDGQVNGQPMPESDYWFKIAMSDGEEYKGHFSLVR